MIEKKNEEIMEIVKKKRRKIKRDYYEREERSKQNKNVRNISKPRDVQDAMKFELCNHIIGFMRRHSLKQKKVVGFLKEGGATIDEGKMSLIVNLKYHDFALERLFSLVEVLAKTDDVSKLYLKSKTETPMMPMDSLMYDQTYVEKKIILIEDNEDIDREFIEAPDEIYDLLVSWNRDSYECLFI